MGWRGQEGKEKKGTNLLIVLNPLLHTAKVVDLQRWQLRFDHLKLRNECVVTEAEDCVDLSKLAKEFYRFLVSSTLSLVWQDTVLLTRKQLRVHRRAHRDGRRAAVRSVDYTIISTTQYTPNHQSILLLSLVFSHRSSWTAHHNTYSPVRASGSSQYTHHTAS